MYRNMWACTQINQYNRTQEWHNERNTHDMEKQYDDHNGSKNNIDSFLYKNLSY